MGKVKQKVAKSKTPTDAVLGAALRILKSKSARKCAQCDKEIPAGAPFTSADMGNAEPERWCRNCTVRTLEPIVQIGTRILQAVAATG